MMYLSKGLVACGDNKDIFYVSHCGRVFAMGPEQAKLWQSAQHGPKEVPAGKERLIQSMAGSGIVSVTEETGKLAKYRLLTDCIICPEHEAAGWKVFGRDRRIWTWIQRAGLRLTASELIRLEEQGQRPEPSLLGEDGRQQLTEQIYSRETIHDGILETAMEQSAVRDACVASLLRLLRAGKLYLV